MRIESRHHFAIAIHSAMLPGFGSYGAALKDEILTASKSTRGVARTNRGRSWHSAGDLHTRSDGAIAEAVREILQTGQ